MSEEDEKSFKKATHCHICEEKFRKSAERESIEDSEDRVQSTGLRWDEDAYSLKKIIDEEESQGLLVSHDEFKGLLERMERMESIVSDVHLNNESNIDKQISGTSTSTGSSRSSDPPGTLPFSGPIS